MRKLLGSKQGFTLVEILVAVGILSMVMLMTATMIENLNKAQKGISEAQSVAEIVNTINLVLNRGDVCHRALVGPPVEDNFKGKDTSVLLKELTIPVESGTSSHTIIKSGEKVPGVFSLEVPSDGITLKNLGALQLDGKPMQEIRRNSNGSDSKYNLYLAELGVNIRKSNLSGAFKSLGVSSYFRKFTLTVGFNQDGGSLDLCNVESSAAQECQNALGGSYDESGSAPKCHLKQVVSKEDFTIGTNGASSVDDSTVTHHKFVVTKDGNVGIGVDKTRPLRAKLEIDGELKLGKSNLPCTTESDGTLKYADGMLQVCNGTDWVSALNNTPKLECELNVKNKDASHTIHVKASLCVLTSVSGDRDDNGFQKCEAEWNWKNGKWQLFVEGKRGFVNCKWVCDGATSLPYDGNYDDPRIHTTCQFLKMKP